jgi:hypothetical protein
VDIMSYGIPECFIMKTLQFTLCSNGEMVFKYFLRDWLLNFILTSYVRLNRRTVSYMARAGERRLCVRAANAMVELRSRVGVFRLRVSSGA